MYAFGTVNVRFRSRSCHHQANANSKMICCPFESEAKDFEFFQTLYDTNLQIKQKLRSLNACPE
jgi:hypothetical protein